MSRDWLRGRFLDDEGKRGHSVAWIFMLWLWGESVMHLGIYGFCVARVLGLDTPFGCVLSSIGKTANAL